MTEERRKKRQARDREYSKAWQKANPAKVRAHHKAYYGANAQKVRASSKAYYEANRDKSRAYSKAYRRANPEKMRAGWLWRKYGITPGQWEAWRRRGCWLCGTSFDGVERRKIHVDHSHATSENRGLAHNTCNAAIGLLGEDADKLARITEALRATQGRTQHKSTGEENV